VAATLVSFFKSMGQAIGVAIGWVILDNQLQKRMSDAVANGATKSSQAFATYPNTLFMMIVSFLNILFLDD
jgi:hypothetical protein